MFNPSVGLTHQVVGGLRVHAAAGRACLMVSSDLPEVLATADRVIVMREGRIVGEHDREGLTPERLVRAAAGLATVEAGAA